MKKKNFSHRAHRVHRGREEEEIFGCGLGFDYGLWFAEVLALVILWEPV